MTPFGFAPKLVADTSSVDRDIVSSAPVDVQPVVVPSYYKTSGINLRWKQHLTFFFARAAWKLGVGDW